MDTEQNESGSQKRFIIQDETVQRKTIITFLIVWKTSSTARGMTPGMCPPPIMVKVFPEEVCPYANMVPVDQTHVVNVRSYVF